MGKQMAETVFRLFLTEVKAFLAFEFNWERLPCFLAGACVVAGCDVDVDAGCGFGGAANPALALTWLTDAGAVSVERERVPAILG